MKAIAYLRVSTREQDDRGYSLPTQLQDIRAYATRQGLEIVQVVSEDESGFLLERPKLVQVRQALKAGQAEALIVHDDDRLTRSAEHSILLRGEFERQGTRLHYALRGEIDLSDFGQQIGEDIRARVRTEEVRKFRERANRGKRGAVQSGKVVVAQKPPFGYRQSKDGRQLVIHEEEAEVVRLIFRLFVIHRFSIRRIRAHLEAAGIQTPGDKNPRIAKRLQPATWHTSLIADILKRETYAGLWHWGKTRRWREWNGERWVVHMTKAPREEWLAVEVPAIIDRATFEKARQLLAENKQQAERNMRHREHYLLAKRLTCGYCGGSVYCETHTYGGRQKSTYWFYCCGNPARPKAPGCKRSYVQSFQVDIPLWQFIHNVLSDPDEMSRLVNASLEQMETNRETCRRELESVQANIKRRERSLEVVLNMLIDEALGEDVVRQKVAQLRGELDRLRGKARELSALIETEPPQVELLKLARQMDKHRNTMNRAHDAPFEVRLAWIEALNIRGTLRPGGDNVVRYDSDMGTFTLPIVSEPATKSGHNAQLVLQLPLRIPRP